VKDSREFARKITSIAPGTAANVSVFRNGQERTIRVTLGELPGTSTETTADQRTTSQAPTLGLTLAPASSVPAAGDRGVVMIEINPTGRAAESGLRTGDVIIELGNRARAQSKRAILLRSDAMSFVALPLG
jgi:serine protease Do